MDKTKKNLSLTFHKLYTQPLERVYLPMHRKGPITSTFANSLLKGFRSTCLLCFAFASSASCGAEEAKQASEGSKTKSNQLQSLSSWKEESATVLHTHFPFFNRSFDKKRLKGLLSWYYANKGEVAALAMVETLQKVGFTYAMKAGISLGVDDLKVPAAKAQFLEEAVESLNATKASVYNGSVTAIEEFQQFIDTWHRTSESLKESVVQNFTMGLQSNSVASYFRGNRGSTVPAGVASFAVPSFALQSKQGAKNDLLLLPMLAFAKQEAKHSNSAKQSKSNSKVVKAKQQQEKKHNNDFGLSKSSKELEKNQEKKTSFRSYGDTLNPVYMMAFSGARGNLSQVRQLVGMRGLMADPQGQLVEFPIQSNFREGLTVTEYMISCYGARKGLVDTALRTAAAGYLTRRLVDVSHHQVVRTITCSTKDGIWLRLRSKDKQEQNRNNVLPPAWKIPLKHSNTGLSSCKAKANGTTSKLPAFTAFPEQDTKEPTPKAPNKKVVLNNKNLLVSCVGRVLARDIPGVAFRNQEVDTSLGSAPLLKEVYENFGIYVRSPLTCKAETGICQLCYGWSVSANKLVGIGEAVGVIAAQSIGEPGTQLTMRTFHTGGVFSGDIMEECRAKHAGTVSFQGTYLGLLVRTEGGRIAFCIKNSAVLQVIGPNTCTSYSIAANTLLFVRQGEKVTADSLLAQIPNLPSMEEKPGESTKTISSALSGEIRKTPTISSKLGNIRILSGQRQPNISRLLPGSHRLGTGVFDTCSLDNKYFALQTQQETKEAEHNVCLPYLLASSASSASSASCEAEEAEEANSKHNKVREVNQISKKTDAILLWNSTQFLSDLRYFINLTVITGAFLYKDLLKSEILLEGQYKKSYFQNLKNRELLLPSIRLDLLILALAKQKKKKGLLACLLASSASSASCEAEEAEEAKASKSNQNTKKQYRYAKSGCLESKSSIDLLQLAYLFWKKLLLTRIRYSVSIKRELFLSQFQSRANNKWWGFRQTNGQSPATSLVALPFASFALEEPKEAKKVNAVSTILCIKKQLLLAKQKNCVYIADQVEKSNQLAYRPNPQVVIKPKFTKNLQRLLPDAFTSLKEMPFQAMPAFALLAVLASHSQHSEASKQKAKHSQQRPFAMLASNSKQLKSKANSSKQKNIVQQGFLGPKDIKTNNKQKILQCSQAFSILSCKMLSRFQTTPSLTSRGLIRNAPIVSSSWNSTAGEVFPIFSVAKNIKQQEDVSEYLLSKDIDPYLSSKFVLAKQPLDFGTKHLAMLAFAKQEAKHSNSAKHGTKEAKPGLNLTITHYDRVSYNLLPKDLYEINNSYNLTQDGGTLKKQVGSFVNQREEIVKGFGSSDCGQIIEKSFSQITLRLAQNILYSDYADRSAKIHQDLDKWIYKGTPVVTLPYSSSVTGDIVAGIPKIEQFFEARGEALEEAVEALWANYEFKIRPKAKAVRECFIEIGLFVVQAIQAVYLSQGVHIADKHLEVIVRQMTRRACIIDPGDTSFLAEEFVDLQTIECVNWTTYGKGASYRPRLVGITRASLNSTSFLSSASFQQTARVLERETFKEKTDRFLGLKERVMIGALIDAGTGGFQPEVRMNSSNNIYDFSSIAIKKEKN